MIKVNADDLRALASEREGNVAVSTDFDLEITTRRGIVSLQSAHKAAIAKQVVMTMNRPSEGDPIAITLSGSLANVSAIYSRLIKIEG